MVTMNKWKLWAGIIVLFLSGATLGVMGTVMYVHHHIRSMVKEGPESFNRLIMLHFDRELDLSEEQEAAILRIITETHRNLLHYRSEHDPHLREIMEKGVEKIKGHLPEEKHEKVDALFLRILHDMDHPRGLHGHRGSNHEQGHGHEHSEEE